MQERILNLLSMCMQAKEKEYDCFFWYSPHIEAISIDVHNPWKESDRDENGEYISGTSNKIKGFCFSCNDKISIDEAEAYLKELIG